MVLFYLILYVPSTIFQLCRDGSAWVEPVKLGLMCLAQGHNAATLVRLEPAALSLQSSTPPLRYVVDKFEKGITLIIYIPLRLILRHDEIFHLIWIPKKISEKIILEQKYLQTTKIMKK